MAGARRCAIVVPKSTVSPSMIPYRRAGGPIGVADGARHFC
jgi:hypothetical protein